MGKIIVLVGPPNSGKTTWTKKFLMNNRNYVKVSRDDFRLMFLNRWRVNDSLENVINKSQYDTINNLLNEGYDVIIDNSHCEIKDVESIVNNFSDKHEISFKVFDVDLNTILARNTYRNRIDGKDIPETELKQRFNNFVKLKEKFNFESLID